MNIEVLSNCKHTVKLLKDILDSFGLHSYFNEEIQNSYGKNLKEYVENLIIHYIKKEYGGKPIIIIFCGFHLENQNDFPGPLTEELWRTLKIEQWNQLFEDKNVSMETLLCYSNGAELQNFSICEKGKLLKRTNDSGHWEDLFLPTNKSIVKEQLFRFVKSISETSVFQSVHQEQVQKEYYLDQLADLLQNKKLILFAGAGVSANLGIPTWEELMEYIAKDSEISYNPQIFKCMGSYLELMEYYSLKKNGVEELKEWMCSEWNGKEIQKENLNIHNRIVELDFPIVYTTNFEHWLEKAYQNKKPVQVISTISDMQVTEDFKTKIIKFHGDCEKTDLVLTEESHFERMDFETALDIQFRADLLQHSVLFIGYSLSDMNVRYMLYRMQKMKEKLMDTISKPSIYFVTHKYNPINREILKKRGIITIYEEQGLLHFLNQIYQRINKKPM